MLVRVLVLFLKASVFFQWHTTFNKSKHASQTGWYVWKWQNPVSVSVGTTHSTVKIKCECQEFVMFTVVFPYMHPEGANIHASVMDEDDFDEFLTNKINNSVIVWTVMTFHLLLLKQDIIMLLFSHFKQVLPSSWTDLSHLVKQCPTAIFFLLCAATMCWQCNSGSFRITRASDTTNNHVWEIRAIFVTRHDWCGQGHVSSEGRLSRFSWTLKCKHSE